MRGAYVILTFVCLTSQLKAAAINELGICSTPTCIQEAARVYQYINPEIDPCDDFYEFVCGTFWKTSHYDGPKDFPSEVELLSELATKQKIDMLERDTSKDDEKILQIVKRLHEGCKDNANLGLNLLPTLKKVFDQLGKWPIFEGSDWKEDDFDWLEVTHKLTEMGYDTGSFFDLSVAPSVMDPDEFIFQIEYKEIPEAEPNLLSNFVNRYTSDDTAAAAAAESLKEAHTKWVEASTSWLTDESFYDNQFILLENLNYRVPSINWVEFINRLTPPDVKVTGYYSVWAQLTALQKLTNFISVTPKRTIANLLMWKVLQVADSYLLDDQLSPGDPPGEEEVLKKRIVFCFNEVGNEFFNNPLDVIYDKRYLSTEKRAQIKNMFQNIQEKAIDILNYLDVYEGYPRIKEQLLVNKIKTIQIGLPENYYDKDFSFVDHVMINIGQQSFLDLLTTVRRQSKLLEYHLVEDVEEDQLYHLLAQKTGIYINNDFFYFPAYATLHPLFDEKRPQYLNYAVLGYFFNTTDVICERCLPLGVSPYTFKAHDCYNITHSAYPRLAKALLTASVKLQITYEAYQKWIENNGVEEKLVGVQYTPNQLFWITIAQGDCRFNSRSSALYPNSPYIWNAKFVEDFKCPNNSKMNPIEKCDFF